MRKVVDYRLLSPGFSDRLKFAQNMYNLIDRLNEPSQPEAKDEIEQFKNAITEYERDYDPCALITKTSTRRNRSGDDDDSTDGQNTTPHAGARDAEELELRGYEVIPDIIVDSKGGELKSMNPVSRPLCCRCLLITTDSEMFSFLLTYSDYAVIVSIAKN